MQLFEKLKKRWQIESNFQIVIILIVFACTGFSALYAKEFIFGWLGITEEMAWWLRALIWLVTIFPVYNVLLIFYGILFGQYSFFSWFLKKMFRRFYRTSDKESNTQA